MDTSSPPSSLSKHSIVELEYSFKVDVLIGSTSRKGRVISEAVLTNLEVLCKSLTRSSRRSAYGSFLRQSEAL